MNRGKNEHIHELQKDIGKLLSEKRLSMGLSLAEIESQTKISQAFLKDIELGNFEGLPGKLFGRGFIKNICKVLNINSEPVLEIYERSWIYIPEAIGEKPHSSSFLREHRDHKLSYSPSIFRNVSWSRISLLIFVPLFAATLVFVIRFLSQRGNQSVPLSTSNQESGVLQISNETDLTGLQNPVESAVPLMSQSNLSSQVGMNKNPVVDMPMLPEHMSLLVLTVREEVKIKHRIMPEEFTSTTFTPGVYKFPFEGEIEFILPNAGAVEINFNGKNLGFPGKKGEEKSLSFSNTNLVEVLEKKHETAL